MKFLIDFPTWRCGKDGPNKLGEGETLLLNSEDYMCCLGHIELQLGLTKEQILRRYIPAETGTENILAKEGCWGFGKEIGNTPLAHEAIRINDDERATPAEKMVALKELFAKHVDSNGEPLEVEFINVPKTVGN